MNRIKLLTFVIGVAPFAAAFSATSAQDDPSGVVELAQSAPSPATVASPPDFLKALVRLLARQAAQEAFATRCTSTHQKETDK